MSTEQESRLLETIQTFEQILELFPEDPGALESLAVAYEQAGDALNAQEMFMRLIRLLAAGEQWGKVHAFASRVLTLNSENEEALEFSEKAGELLGNETVGFRAKGQNVVLAFDFLGERELGGFLQQRGMISRQVYEAACKALEENQRLSGGDACLTLLSEFEVMEEVDVDALVDFLCRETNTAFVDLSCVDPEPDVTDLVDLDQCRRLGIMPFATMGGEVMVAGMNPLGLDLKQALTAYLGTKVHFYMTTPRAFQAALEKRG